MDKFFNVTFSARKDGAIGIFYPVTFVVAAADELAERYFANN